MQTKAMSAAAFPQAARTLIQTIALALIFVASDWLARHLMPGVPAGVLGLALLLAALAAGIVPRRWLAEGARWLLGEMLLFFIPAVIAVMQYADLVREHGLAILAVIVGSTFCVMASTALAVDLTWRLEAKLRKEPA